LEIKLRPTTKAIPVAARSQALIAAASLLGLWPIPRPEELYRVFVTECDQVQQ